MPIRPPLRQALRCTPQKVVVQFLGRRLLEAEDLAALRIDAAHDVLDRPVLAGRVHRLQDDQHRVPVVRVEEVLGLGQVGQVLREHFLGPLLDRVLAEVLELDRSASSPGCSPSADLPVGRHAEQVDDVFANHGLLARCVWVRRSSCWHQRHLDGFRVRRKVAGLTGRWAACGSEIRCACCPASICSGVMVANRCMIRATIAGPAGLVAGPEPGPVVAVEVLVEQDEVPPVRVVLELLGRRRRPAAGRPCPAGRCSPAGGRSPRPPGTGSSAGRSRSGTRR